MKSVIVACFCHNSCCLSYSQVSCKFRNIGAPVFRSLFSNINISQGTVATHLRCGGIFNGNFIANFLQIVAVKEFLKSVNIWRSYELEYGVSLFFDSRCINMPCSVCAYSYVS